MVAINKLRRLPAVLFFCIAFLLAVPPIYPQAIEPKQAEKREIVFMLDASNSMNRLETSLAMDAIKLMLYSLPSNSQSGFIRFNTSVKAAVPLDEHPAGADSALSATVFTGYSNTGAGLQEALSLFTETPGVSRHVVLISDGEIIMESEKETQASLSRFEDAAADASRKGIVVDTIMLGEEDRASNVVKASLQTGGQVYWVESHAQLLEAAENILFSNLGVRQSVVAAGGAQNGHLNITLPDTAMSRAKILLTSDFALNNVTAAANAADVRVITGSRFAVVELDAPTQTGISIVFDAVNKGEIRARLIPEYEVALSAKVIYPELIMTGSEPEPELLPPTMAISAQTPCGDLWKSTLFEGKTVPFLINGDPAPIQVENGLVEFLYSGKETAAYTVSADFSGFEGNFLSVKDVSLIAPRPPAELQEPEANYWPLVIALILLAGGLALILLLEKRGRIQRRQKPLLEDMPEDTPTSRFSGKLNIYVTRMPDDSDVPPQTVSLFREKQDKLRLHSILSNCGIDLGDADDYDILLKPGKSGALLVTNNSNGTVLHNRDLIMKGKTFEIYFEEKINISFENGSEVLLHYKNVKPSERV